MLSLTSSKDKPSVIKFNGFSLTLFSNTNYLNNKQNSYALHFTPDLKFSAKLIPNKKYHFIFDIDISGSMGGFFGDMSSLSPNINRINIVKSGLIESINFLAALAKQGKEIFISIVTFHTQSSIIVNHNIINGNMNNNQHIIEKINDIILGGATNLGCSIDNIEVLKKDSFDHEICSILISDGYINNGQCSSELINQYPKYFDTTIGIGKEFNYDKKLLQELSQEDNERSCNSVTEMKDQIIDSVFGNLGNVLEYINLGNEYSVENVVPHKKDADNNIIIDNIKITSHIFAVIKSNYINISLGNISSLYMEAANIKLDKSGVTSICSNISHCIFGNVEVIYKINSNSTYNIDLKISIKPLSITKKMLRYYNIIEKYCYISGNVAKLDLENINLEQKKITSLYKHCKAIERLIHFIDDDQLLNYITKIISKYKNGLKPYIKKDNYPNIILSNLNSNYIDSLNHLAPPTLLRMTSSQASSGSFAFEGRQVSMGYVDMNGSNINNQSNNIQSNSPATKNQNSSTQIETSSQVNICSNNSESIPNMVVPRPTLIAPNITS